MPSIGEFSRDFAGITGTEFGAVVKLQRVLRDAGLLTSGARGVNAPDLTPLDAARMLIAVLVTDKPSLAPRAVEEFGKLASAHRHVGQATDLETGSIFSDLANSQSLEETLAALIQALSTVPENRKDLASRTAGVSCTANNLTANVHWLGGSSSFSTIGPWLHLLSDTRQHADELRRLMLAESAAAARARPFAGYGVNIKIERTASGELLWEIAALFRSDIQAHERMVG